MKPMKSSARILRTSALSDGSRAVTVRRTPPGRSCRRTRIAQCVPRAGLGRHGENLCALAAIARTLAGGDAARAEADLTDYLQREVARHDRLLGLAAPAHPPIPNPPPEPRP